jgi:hypothetical protein
LRQRHVAEFVDDKQLVSRELALQAQQPGNGRIRFGLRRIRLSQACGRTRMRKFSITLPCRRTPAQSFLYFTAPKDGWHPTWTMQDVGV